MKFLRKTTLLILIACFATAFTSLLAACDMPTGNSGSKPSSSADIHELTEVAEVAATCSSEGTKAYYRCSGCDKLFADANGEIEIDEPEKTEKIAHTEEDIPDKAPTCTEVGYTGGKRCSVCHEILVEPEELPMIAHTEEDIPGKAPTCTEVGYTGGKRCSVCHEILVEPEELPMIDHTREAIPDKEATCTQDGHTGGEWCSVCHEIFVEPTVTTAGGHKFVDGSCVHGCGYHYLTLVDATAEGLEKTDGVYIVKEGTNVTIKAAFDPECLFAGFERDGIAGSYSQTGDCYEYTFTMPASAVAYKAVYRNATDLTLKSTLVKNA
ncbi:MAG: hypothetical protein IJ811_00835, partial [Clostridia bacterium]|nr:hypothetical protein [Clostridia bacterium]